MGEPLQACPKCGASRDGTQPGLQRCPNCGADFDLTRERRAHWRLFWLLFFGTPIFAIAALMVTRGGLQVLRPALPMLRFAPDLAAPAALIIGALGAGYFLAKTHTRTTAALIVGSVIYAIGTLLVYGAIFFAGCLAVMAAFKNV